MAASKKVGSATDRTPIPLATIRISRLNPRYGGDGDITGLAADIEGKGLLQPLPLHALEGGGYEAVFGTRRLRALKQIRGKNGFLEPGEYHLVDWNDTECIANAVAENEQREGLSPFEAGSFLNRIAEVLEDVTDEKLVKLTHLGDRPTINELRELARKFDLLPAAWQSDLRKPMVCSSLNKPTITRTHFRHVRSRIGNDSIPADVVDVMEKAAVEEWSAATFKTALEALKPTSGTEQPAVAGTGKPQMPTKEPGEVVEIKDQPPATSDQPAKVPTEPTKVPVQPPQALAAPLNAQHDDTRAEPGTPGAKYKVVIAHLNKALNAYASPDSDIAKRIQDLIDLVTQEELASSTEQVPTGTSSSSPGDATGETTGKEVAAA